MVRNQMDDERRAALAALGDFIRSARLRRNLTQDRLARLADVSRAQLVGFEKGANVSLDFLMKVARVLELSEIPVGFLTLSASTPLTPALLAAAEALDEVRARMPDASRRLDEAAAVIERLRACPPEAPSGDGKK